MKWSKVMPSYLITGVASAGVACLFVLAVALLCRVAETGSAADWVASVANVVMAIRLVMKMYWHWTRHIRSGKTCTMWLRNFVL